MLGLTALITLQHKVQVLVLHPGVMMPPVNGQIHTSLHHDTVSHLYINYMDKCVDTPINLEESNDVQCLCMRSYFNW